MGRPVIGKKELLQWASETSGKACQRLEDLQDGSILLRIFARIWPQAFRGREDRLKAHLWDVKRNWEALRSLFLELRLPLHVFDPAGIQRSSFKPCYAILVMCFFLQQLAEDRSFSCDFAYPIDQQLADFLQSRGSIALLSRQGSLKVVEDDKAEPRTDDEERRKVLVEVSRKAFMRQESNGSKESARDEIDTPRASNQSRSPDSHSSREGSVDAQAPVEWRSPHMKFKGELLLANLRFENDSLRRQMEASVQERHFLVTRYEQECKEFAAAHAAELQSQAEALRGEFAVERLKLAAERGKDQQRFVLELSKVADGLRAEAQRANRGEDGPPSYEEMSKLKQQLLASACARAVQEDQTRALEKRCASLEAEISRQQEELKRLHVELSGGCRPEIDGPQLLSPEEGQGDSGARATGREVALLRQLRKMARDATQAELSHSRVEEDLKLKVWKLEQGLKEGRQEETREETFGALLQEFEEEHTSERLRSEVKRLQTDNAFLRQRAAVIDRYNLRTPPKSDGLDADQQEHATWLPRENVSTSAEEDERIAAELLETLKARVLSGAHESSTSTDGLASGRAHKGSASTDNPATESAQNAAKRTVELFWKMVVAQAVLKQRVGRAALELRAVRASARAAEKKRAEEQRAAEERLEAVESAHKEEVFALTYGSRQEIALLTVKKGLLDNELADLRREMEEAMLEIQRSRTAAQQQHEEKFQLLKKRLRESRSETSQLRLKEQHFARLVSFHREAAALCEHVAITAMTAAGPAFQPGLPPDHVVAVRCAPRGTIDEIRALIKKKADLDAQAAACLDGIKAVENLVDGREPLCERHVDELDQVVGEATEVLKEEIARFEKGQEALRQKVDALTVRTSDLEIALRQKEGQLVAEGARKAAARKEADRLLATNAKLQKRLVEQKEMVDQEVSRLHVQLMEAMMRLDEQSAILDASMRLGMIQFPEEDQKAEREKKETKDAGSQKRSRIAAKIERGTSNGPAREASVNLGDYQGEGKDSGKRDSQELVDTAEAVNTRKDGDVETRAASTVPGFHTWVGTLLEIAEAEVRTDRDTVTSEKNEKGKVKMLKQADGLGYGRPRMASLTPIPESPDGRAADTCHEETERLPQTRAREPERLAGQTDDGESRDLLQVECKDGTWQAPKARHVERNQGQQAERAGDDAGDTCPKKKAGLSECQQHLVMAGEGREDKERDTWQEQRVGGSTEREGNQAKAANQVEERKSEASVGLTDSQKTAAERGDLANMDEEVDPIVQMIRRISRSSTDADGGAKSEEADWREDNEANQGPMEEGVSKGESISEPASISAAQNVVVKEVTVEGDLEGSARNTRSADTTEDSGDNEWVEKKVVGIVPEDLGSLYKKLRVPSGDLSSPREDVGTLLDDVGTSSQDLAVTLAEGRPAALRMHSPMLPNYVVNWSPFESPQGRTEGSSLRSPMSPPPYALPDMA